MKTPKSLFTLLTFLSIGMNSLVGQTNLNYFSITQKDSTLQLNWETTYEIKIFKFILEESYGFSDYTFHGEIPSNINSITPNTYNYSHKKSHLVVGNYSYRLIACQTNGGKQYFGPVDIFYSDSSSVLALIDKIKSESYVIYPNPVTNDLNIRFNDDKSSRVAIMDHLGREITSFNNSEQFMTVDCTEFKPGVFFVKVEKENHTTIQKFVVIK